jgi:hypothetical protein
VFTFLTDTDYQHLYDRSLLQVERKPNGPMRQGSKITETRKVMGREIATCFQVTEYEPFTRYIGRSLSGTESGTRLFQANEKGTRVTYRLECGQMGLAAFFAPIFGRFLKRALDQDMAQAKNLLEVGKFAQDVHQEKQS